MSVLVSCDGPLLRRRAGRGTNHTRGNHSHKHGFPWICHGFAHICDGHACVRPLLELPCIHHAFARIYHGHACAQRLLELPRNCHALSWDCLGMAMSFPGNARAIPGQFHDSPMATPAGTERMPMANARWQMYGKPNADSKEVSLSAEPIPMGNAWLTHGHGMANACQVHGTCTGIPVSWV